MRDNTILIFGDSISYGLLDEELGSLANRMRVNLQKDKAFGNCYIYDLSILGQTSGNIKKRFEHECKSRINKWDNFIIIFAVGIKDAQIRKNNKNRTNIIQFKENILALIKKAKKYSDNIFFVGLTKVDESKERYKGYFNEEVIKYDNELEKVCNENKINYIKVYNLLNKNEITDGLHPNSVANQKLCNKILKNIMFKIEKN